MTHTSLRAFAKLALLFAQWEIVKGVKTEWVQVWANSNRFAIYAVKLKKHTELLKP